MAAQCPAHEKTHPWLLFERSDITRASYRTWMLLGEAVSKCLHIARVPLRPATAQELHRVFLAKGIHGTTAIEGNTLSEEEVKRSIEGKLKLPASREYLEKEVDNILRACNLVGREIAEQRMRPLSVARLTEFNALVLEGLPLGEGAVPGRIRRHRVGVGGYVPPDPRECFGLLDRLCGWLSRPILPAGFPHKNASDAIIRAILAHLYVAWIHPFGDGNGRTARLVEFQILLGGGLPTPVAHLLSNHYNKTRAEYYRQLDRARRLPDGICGFIEYALQGLVDGQRDAIRRIWLQQLDTTWRSHVYQQLKDLRNKPGERIRRLAFGFPLFRKNPFPLDAVPDLSPEIARTYARLSERTLRRDLKELVEREVLAESAAGYSANLQILGRWLPRGRLLWEELAAAEESAAT